MAKLRFIERAIIRREGLPDGYVIKFFHSIGGRDVRADKVVAGGYDYVRKLGDDKTVTDLLGRASKAIPGLIPKLVDESGKVVHGATKMKNLRNK